MPDFRSFSRKVRFENFFHSATCCNLCPRLKEKRKVLSELNGSITSKVMFVAEAPGRLGADVTGIPLFGDKTGDNFEILLQSVNWNRKDIFITNAVLCNPQNENGTNSTPTSEEVANCSIYLEMQIELVQPDVLVSLGTTALKALSLIHPHNYTLEKNVGKLCYWSDRQLMPLYHPGPRAHIYRSISKQVLDFEKLASYIHPKNGILIESNQKEFCHNIFQKLIFTIVETAGSMSYFKLTKLLYLIDLFALRELGKTLTGEIYLRQKDGPWPPVLQKSIESMGEREINAFFRRGKPFVEKGPSPRINIDCAEKELSIIDNVLDRYGQLSDGEIKTSVYMTEPMRHILRKEKEEGRMLLNKPVIYNGKTAREMDMDP